jgi:uncharacterized protein (DUF1697 family)
MPTYIALLRGINVSGQKMIKMTELAKLFTSLGFEQVTTYIQSGNVVFRSKKMATKTLQNNIEEQIHKKFGFEVSVIVLEQEDLRKCIQKNSFLGSKDEDVGRLYVTFCALEPDQTHVKALNQSDYLPDEFHVLGSVVYLRCPNGYGRTKFSNNFFESKFKVRATTRNWKTVNELLSIAEDSSLK